MRSIYAFMAGINEYPEEIAAPLGGCVNDITEARRLLLERTGGAAEVRTALDGAATVAAVEEGIRTFLGAAGPGDTALFWYSGHGTRTEASGADLLIEATGWNQALLCADGPLLDKRLGALLDAVAARGVHMVAVLDCCYSGGGTREDREAGLTARFAPPPPGLRFTAGRDVVVPQGPARHVLLAASRLDQLSYEGQFGGQRHGAFTHALLDAVRVAGPDATYRQLLSAAAARVERRFGSGQRPVLYPQAPGGVADLPFLGGAVADTAGELLLRHGAEGWEVDCGTSHGLRDGDGAEGTEFDVVGAYDAERGPVLRARRVHADRTLVDPVGWVPDTGRVYPVALSAVASAPATVGVEGAGEGWPGAAERLRAAVASYGPGGGPAPLLRIVDGPDEAGEPHFRVVLDGGRARVLGRDGTAFVAPLPCGTDADARRVVRCLTHLARWHQLRDLASRPSVLDNLVQVEIVPWDAPDGPPLMPDGSGEIVCRYAPEDAAGPREPWVSIRLRNRSPQRKLWCVLLDLTDGYAADSALFPGHFIGPGRTGYALDGDPVELSLPVGRPAVPGAQVRDWLKLIVAEGELNTAPFQLKAWDAAGAGSRTDGAAARDPGATGVLPFTAPQRPAGPRDTRRVTGGAPGRWATRTIVLRTLVP
jgi:hypothetical protein